MSFESLKEEISWADFQRLDLRAGTIQSAQLNAKAKQPALVLEIDFGPLGVLTSSAQLTVNYSADDLPGQQVICVVNFPSKRIAGVKSQCLVLGVLCPKQGTVLLRPTHPVENGSSIG